MQVEHAGRNTHPVDIPCAIDWESMAATAVDAMADFHREGRRAMGEQV